MRGCKKILVFVLVLSMVVTMLVGCNNNNVKNNQEPQKSTESTESAKQTVKETDQPKEESNVYPENGLPKDQKVTLTVGFMEAGYGRAYYDYAAETFMKKFPNVKIKTTYSPKIGSIVKTRAQAGNDKEMFNLMMPYQPYADAGMLEPLDDVYDHKLYDRPDKTVKEILVDGLYENISRLKDGKIYFMPQSYYVGGMFYDKNLFEEHGWNQDPKTWDEFMQLCESIKAKDIDPITFAGIYNYLGFSIWWHKALEVSEINGNLDEFEKKFRVYETPVYNSPEMIEVYKKVYEMGKKEYFAKGVPALNHTQSQMAVLQHKAAMVSTCDWVENEMKDSTPEGFVWGYMAVPFTNDPDQTIWLQSSDCGSFTVWKNKPELSKKWAKEFLVWMYNMDCQKAITQWAGAFPVRKDFMENPENLESLKNAQKAVLEYMGRHNVRLENNHRIEIHKQGPSASQADKHYTGNVPLISTGKKDPVEILNKCEELFEKSLEEGKKIEEKQEK